MHTRSTFLMFYLILAICCLCTIASAGTVFTYQGKLTDAEGNPANGSFNFVFRIYDAITAGNQIGSGVIRLGFPVTGGLFTVELDFGAVAFDTNEERWLETTVAGQTLSPRTRVNSVPYSIRAETVADGSITTAKLFDNAVTSSKISDVSWSKLTSIPAYLADGDADTTYSAGAGLSLSGTTFSLDTDYLRGIYWALGGNLGTNADTDFIGTTDNQALEFKVNDQRALRLEPVSVSPNIIGGYSANTTLSGVAGAAISGGGASTYPNRVTDHFGTIGGGRGNLAGNDDSFLFNADAATVAGGSDNTAGGRYSTVGGGQQNTAGGVGSAIPGGSQNAAAGDYSLAAGYRAKANHQGTYVWADSTEADFASSAVDQFIVRASGGVGIGVSDPLAGGLDVNGAIQSRSGGFIGSGAGLTDLDASNLSAGTVASDRLSGEYSGITGLGTLSSLRVDNGVGIGTSAPATGLHITGGSSSPQIFLKGPAATQGFHFKSDATPKLYVSESDGATANDILVIDGTTDRVGIGRSTPCTPLHIRGLAAEDALRVRVDGATKLRVHANGGMAIGGNPDSVPENGLYVAGKVGIGTNDPYYPFHMLTSERSAMYVETSSTWANACAIKGRITAATVVSDSAGVTGDNASERPGYGVIGSHYGEGWGVYGRSWGTGKGVVGYAPSTGYAGYFMGNVYVEGTLSKAAGSFRIDHPLDPENKTLSHSFVESPDMMNVYNGNIITDENGEATVILPEYFEALNKDFRYQLTPIGASAPDLYIAKKIQSNQFKIAGGKPGMEVSWQVTGVRQDPYAKANRIKVVEEKSAKDHGRYLNPQAYGKPDSLGIDYDSLNSRLPGEQQTR